MFQHIFTWFLSLNDGDKVKLIVGILAFFGVVIGALIKVISDKNKPGDTFKNSQKNEQTGVVTINKSEMKNEK